MIHQIEARYKQISNRRAKKCSSIILCVKMLANCTPRVTKFAGYIRGKRGMCVSAANRCVWAPWLRFLATVLSWKMVLYNIAPHMGMCSRMRL